MKFKRFIYTLTILLLLFTLGCKQQKKTKTASPEEVVSTRSLGLAYLEENKLDKAEAEFLKLIDLKPDDASGYANLGLVYLRMGKYKEAEDQLNKAVKMDPKNPDIRLILAKVYELSNQKDKAIEVLEKSLKSSPDHLKTLYTLSELYSSATDEGSLQKRYQYIRKLVDKAPANLAARLNLIDILIRRKQADQALAQLEELQKISPEFPKESVDYYKKTINALRKNNLKEAGISFMIFHNYLKVTPPYQAGILKLKGPEGFIGSPVITFDKNKTLPQIKDWKSILEAIRFTDITSQALADMPQSATGTYENTKTACTPIPLAACDYDLDGDIDIYAGYYNPKTRTYKHFLFNNEWGKYHDVAAEAGIRHQGREFSVKFDDYNNDGYPDLYIVREGGNLLYKNTGKGTFAEVTGDAGVGDKTAGNRSVFFDFDHDGDLDLYITRPHENILYRNNGDGTFTDYTKESGLSGGDANSLKAVFADFDDDGDIDLFVLNKNASNILFSNQRQGVFKEVTGASGLPAGKGSCSVASGDYNNDGFQDLFIASSVPGHSSLFRNKGNGTFVADKRSKDLEVTLQHLQTFDAAFLDFDNDGFLDLLVTGRPDNGNGKGVFLFHNDATGKYFFAGHILPEDLISGREIITFDYNEDGDMDIALADAQGYVHLLRNDGGNNLHYLKMKLVGLRTGSGKNNYYGIGAKIEVRAGNLYQSAVVTKPGILFGLGTHTRADVIRILWTNGVPQNIFLPQTDQDLVEQQELKGSCPFLYSWNGSEYVFVKDIMWRSALGMPLGIMGEDKTTRYASSAPSIDYIKIPGHLLQPRNNKYNIRVTDELWEVIYFDKIQLIAVDHPDSVDIFVDERFTPPSGTGFTLYQAVRKHLPLAATNKQGDNLLPLISKKDNRYVSDLDMTQYQGITKPGDLILDLGEIDPAKKLILFLNGWIFPSDASINAAIAQSGKIKLISPYLQAKNKNGEWVTIVDNISFPMGKDKTVVVDLTGKVPTVPDVRLRIRTNMQIYWDHIFYTQDDPSAPVRTYTLDPCAADLHYRGFSRTYRKGGRYGPHWFDYSQVSPQQKWNVQTGYCTRYGDVLPLLTAADDMYVIQNAGDEASIDFDAGDLPALPQGWTRDFLIHSEGWVKDADLNTADGQTVAPLPFHAMTRYPYGPEESYPADKAHREYLKKYNTRKVTAEKFCRAVSDGTIEIEVH